MKNQLKLFGNIEEEMAVSDENNGNSEWGTFKDSLRAPVHNWFTYPAGFSYKAVEYAFRKFNIKKGMTIYDPFTGTGTTNVTAKSVGVNSIGVEAHPFICFVAKTKVRWEYDKASIFIILQKVTKLAKETKYDDARLEVEFPELVRKCFSKTVLKELLSIREAIKSHEMNEPEKDFFNLALAGILRQVANVATGWPYIAPNKKKNGKDKDVISVYSDMVIKMWSDIEFMKNKVTDKDVLCKVINSDSRDTKSFMDNNSIDLIFTSPPYLNNYDYADRTRLETYFFGWTKNWVDISELVRTKLIMSATTQINRSNYNADDIISSELKRLSPGISEELQDKINKLSKIRLTKGGKKSYDILVGGYFNDMCKVLGDCYRILKENKNLCLILGDSAPYGIHIQTEEYLGEIGKSIGYKGYAIELLRKRGDKWKGNPQRHHVELRESILYLKK